MSRIFKFDQIEVGGALLSTDPNGNFVIRNSSGDVILNSSSSVWTPNRFLDLVAWYDASDTSSITESSSIISQVNDKSGNGFHLNVLTAGSTGPKTGVQTLNNLNVLCWDTAGQILENNSFSYDQSANGLCFSTIFKCDVDNSIDFIVAGTESAASGQRMSLRRVSSNDSMQILGGSGTGSNQIVGSGGGSVPEGEDLLITVKFNGSNSAIRVNGIELNSGNIGTNIFSSLNIGGNESESSNLQGYIAEMIFFKDLNKQNESEGYLAHKWGLTQNLPSDHPYKTAQP